MLAANALMSSEQRSIPKKFRLKIACKTYVATYDVEDECVQVTHKGRRSIWTEIGAARAEDVAKMLLKELLGVLLATMYFAALADHAAAVWTSATELHATQSRSTPTEPLLPMDARLDL